MVARQALYARFLLSTRERASACRPSSVPSDRPSAKKSRTSELAADCGVADGPYPALPVSTGKTSREG